MRRSSVGRHAALSCAGIHLRAGTTRGSAPRRGGELRSILGPDIVSARAFSGRRRVEYITARAWIRDLVRDRLNEPWHGFAVRTAGEKPRLHRSDIDVSISHTGEHLVVAVAERGRIGVDVERVGAIFDQPALVHRMCSDLESRRLADIAPAARRAWLTQLWSVKESYAKAIGVGLSQPLAEIDAAGLSRADGVRGVWTPATGDTELKLAVTWLAPR